MAFLINGIVLGVHDVSDGSSQAALDTLKVEEYPEIHIFKNKLLLTYFVYQFIAN